MFTPDTENKTKEKLKNKIKKLATNKQNKNQLQLGLNKISNEANVV